MKNVEQPLGVFVSGNGLPLSGAAVYFLDKNTTNEKMVYVDEGRTTPANNPQILNTSGCFDAQIFLGTGQYTIQILVPNGAVAPVFPADYALLREWIQDGDSSSSVAIDTVSDVAVMADLRALVPTHGQAFRLNGYYAMGDAPSVFYMFDSTEVGADNGGTIVRPNGFAVGAFVMSATSLIDARNFGAQLVGDVTTNISFACGQAFARGCPAYFPAGTYRVTGTVTQTVNAHLIVDAGAFFTVSAGSYILRPLRTWAIGSGSHGTSRKFLFDFTASTDFHSDGCNPTWWNADNDSDSFGVACAYSGVSGLAINQAQTLGEPIATVSCAVSRLVFGSSSSITFANTSNAIMVTIADVVVSPTRANSIGLFLASVGVPASRVAFTDFARSSWLSTGSTGTQDVFGVSSVMVIDNDITVTSASADYGTVVPDGGTITANSCAVGLDIRGTQNEFLVCYTDGTFVGAYNVWLYSLTNATQANGFINSCFAQSKTANFAGRDVTANLSVTTNGTIINAFVDGTLTSSGALTMFSCTITGKVTATSLFAYTSTLSGGYEVNSSKVNACVVASTVTMKDLASSFSHALTNSQCACSIAFNSSANIALLAIKGNTWTAGGTDPINPAGLTSTTYTAGAIDISGNFPIACVDASLPPQVIKQTHIDIDVVIDSDADVIDLTAKRWAFVAPNLTMPARIITVGGTYSIGPNTAQAYGGKTHLNNLTIVNGSTVTAGTVHVQSNLY